MLTKIDGNVPSTGEELKDVKRVTRKMSALIRYAAASRDRRLVTEAVDAKLDAEREGGLTLIAMAQKGERQGQGGDRKSKSSTTILKLDDLGISPDDSSRWQAIARLDDVAFSRRKHQAVQRAWSAWEKEKREGGVEDEEDDGIEKCGEKTICPGCGQPLKH